MRVLRNPVSAMKYLYHPGILEQLRHHGIAPRRETPPEKTYELLKSIYCFRIRELKFRRRELERVLGPQPLDIYRKQLLELRDEYPLLKVPSHHWIQSD